jgi:hypothetical protein
MEELTPKPTIREFLHVIWSDWAARVSGSLSVPFTILALVLGNAYAKAIFVLLAVTAVCVTTYQIWSKERKAVLALQSLQRNAADHAAIRDELALFLVESDDLARRKVRDQVSFDQWKLDLNSWYQRCNQTITEKLSAADAALFRDLSRGGLYSMRGMFNGEHSDLLNALRKYAENLREIISRL